MSENDRRKFDEILRLLGKTDSMETAEAFVRGFKLATAFMVEVFTGLDSQSYRA